MLGLSALSQILAISGIFKMELLEQQNSLDFKIGMLAPSKAGKTTLLAATMAEMKDFLADHPLGFTYNASNVQTRDSIKRVINEYRAINMAGGKFQAPEMRGTQAAFDYSFTLTIPMEGNSGDATVGFIFKDYPGSLIGLPEFEKEVGRFMRECTTMLVPVPSDILMDWKYFSDKKTQSSDRHIVAAENMLYADEICNKIKAWAKYHASRQEKSLLMFVPVRCEAYFNDNGGRYDASDVLFEALQEMYIDRLELSSNELKYVQIDGHAVDTYGTVELSSVRLHSIPNYGEELVSVFSKRPGTGNGIKPKGGLDVLINAMTFEYYKSASKSLDELNSVNEEKLATMTKGDGSAFMEKINQTRNAWNAILQLMNISKPDLLRHRRCNAIKMD